ncbi:DUF29 domain-containing protein [Thioflexithrix psekupsensis]|uniref:DUF29 domain-containing protein n=1 Tax=Thioflexithrix psekupsensis TaxID=1570016 RepID=A0A251X847_9GAMM|nr:DUF29 domain-containing protein [Thioflexithrix psekupsensis]OUD13964.1 hypothetical protein TPSD3_06365 [Thioflexithrix psekupsensis]
MNDLAVSYEKDYHQWIEQHIQLLKTGQWHALDTVHLIEELEGMANRDKHELVSHLVILMAHLLRWQFQLKHLTERWGEFQGNSWRASMIEQRYRVQAQLEHIPSLKNALNDSIIRAYPKAVLLAAKETGLDKNHFPIHCPYTVEQILDDDFYPQAN